jgi:hypothetical protein
MTKSTTVLSLNPDGQTLLGYESVLQENGYQTITARSPLEARFEIAMGRCGVFLASYITPAAIYRDLASLFRQNCPSGIVIFVAQNPNDRSAHADVNLAVQDEPHTLIERLLSRQR